MSRRWYRNTLIWLNAASGACAFMATAWVAAADSLPIPKWSAVLIGSVVAAANVGLHFIISDPTVVHDIERSDGRKGKSRDGAS